eukprot:TRINITY_DN30816_c0_g1_i1.p1 TRINITY_DN30816_c0_g1~~TRINITY_DN30816_c0_g1_i1.p1  ORF type:complete len:573 (+),score=43.19 TRINITY_DN30816_c0_g1_i1:93-1721(+)
MSVNGPPVRERTFSKRSFRSNRSNRSDGVSSQISLVGSVIEDFVEDVSTLLGAERYDEDRVAKPLHTTAVVFNLCNTTMGVGILSLAATYSYAGLVFGPSIMVICAATTYLSVVLMLRIINSNRVPCDYTRVPTMEEMAEYSLGKRGRLWVQSVLIAICLGTLVAYLVSIKGLLYEGVEQVLPDDVFNSLKNNHFNKNTSMLAGLVIVALPLSFLRRIDGLWFTSFLSVLSILYFVVMSVIYYSRHHTSGTQDPCHELANNHKEVDPSSYLPEGGVSPFPSSVIDMLQAFSIISMSYICQLTVFPIMKELAKGQRGGGNQNPVASASNQLAKATMVTMFVSCAFYTVAGSMGYATWQSETTKPTTILACYPTTNNIVIPVYFCMTLMLLFSFPLITFTCRCTIANILYPDTTRGKETSLSIHIGLTLAICVPCVVVAMVSDHLTTVLSVVSALTSPSLCFLLPGVCYHMASVKEMSYEDPDESAENEKLVTTDEPLTEEEQEFVSEQRLMLKNQRWGGHVMISIGVFMQIACLIAAVVSVAG